MGPMAISEFQSSTEARRSRKSIPNMPRTQVDARDVRLSTLQRLVAQTNDEEARNKYIAELSDYQRHIDAMDVAWFVILFPRIFSFSNFVLIVRFFLQVIIQGIDEH